MRHVGGLHELRGDPHARARAADAAFEDVVDSEIALDLSHILSRALVQHRRGAGDHAKVIRIQCPQLRDHFLGEAVAEEFLFSVVAQVLERQDGEGHARRGPARRARADPQVQRSSNDGHRERAGSKEQHDARRSRDASRRGRGGCGHRGRGLEHGRDVRRRRPGKSDRDFNRCDESVAPFREGLDESWVFG